MSLGLCVIIIFLSTCFGELLAKVSYVGNEEENEFPYIVALRINGLHKCTGSILDKRHVLTAAHCVIQRSQPIHPEEITIRYGTGNFPEDKTIIKVESYCYHDDYIINRNGIHPHDIALLKLNEDIVLSNKVKAIHLPQNTMKLPKKTVVRVARWRMTKKKHNPDFLRNVDLRIYEGKKCKESFDYIKTKYQFCASTKDRKASCKGYTGGPLVIKENDTAILLGILSGGSEDVKECGSNHFPGIYLKVSRYINWIQEHWQYYKHNEL